MFQKDYWSMKDEELETLAGRYHIPPGSYANDGNNVYFDRDRIIKILVDRDNALRTKMTTVLSIAALVVSIASLVVSVLKISRVS
jgi:hypothetical protein